jgi:hypothetical protein
MWHGDLQSEHKRLRELTRRNLLQLIESEFTLAHTMTDLAETELELRDQEHARVLLRKVRDALEAVRQRLASADVSDTQRNEIIRQFGELEPRLEAIREQLRASAGKPRLSAEAGLVG